MYGLYSINVLLHERHLQGYRIQEKGREKERGVNEEEQEVIDAYVE